MHSPDGGNTVHKFLKPGSWYSVPYRSLVTPGVENLIVAGRCLSATHVACSAVRVTPVLMGIAQAAGTAAAQSAHTDMPANNLDTNALREQLKADGVFWKSISLDAPHFIINNDEQPHCGKVPQRGCFLFVKKHHHNFFQPSFVIHCTRLSDKSLYNRF